jgi:hypothetical protein
MTRKNSRKIGSCIFEKTIDKRADVWYNKHVMEA